MKEEKNIEDLFRSSFEDFEVAPPVQLKERIDARLNEGRKPLFWWIAGSVVFVVALVSAVVWFSSDPVSTSPVVSQTNDTLQTSGVELVPSPDSHPSSHTVSSGKTTQENTKISSGTDVSSDSREQVSSRKEGVTSYRALKPAGEKNTHSQLQSEKSGKTNKETSHKKSSKGKAKKRKAKKGQKNYVDSGNSHLPLGSDVADNGNAGNPFNGMSNPPEPPEADSTNLPENPADSTKRKPEIGTPAAETTTIPETPAKPDNKPGSQSLWTVSLFGSPYSGTKAQSFGTQNTLHYRTGYQFAAEVNRSLVKGAGFSTGIGYTSYLERMEHTSTSYDSVFVGIDTVGNYIGDSLISIDTIYLYAQDTIHSVISQQQRIQTISIPLMVSYQWNIGAHWGVMGRAGAVLRLHTVRSGQGDSLLPLVTTHPFTVALSGRIHAVYRAGNWMFSAGVAGLSELKPPVLYNGEARRRQLLTAELGVHYTF